MSEKICGWQSFAFPVSGMLGGGILIKQALVIKITGVHLTQVGNNRNDHFRYFLGVRVRLIEVSI